MAIERKDRSFDRIFDEVSVDRVPMDYVMSVKVHLQDGTIMELDRSQLDALEEEGGDIFDAIKRDDVADIAISLDYDSIKNDVSATVKTTLAEYFDEE